VKVRLMGTPEELDAALPVLRAALEVVEESGRYANRPPSALQRVYLEVASPQHRLRLDGG